MPIGNEPPLTLTENSRAALKRGSVSWRWLAGAFITGVCGAALIGGALFSSVEGAIHFAEPMRDWSIAKSLDLDMGLGDRNSSTAKSDKLDIARETEVARKVVQISAERQVGKKKFISIRPYELVTIPLATTVSEISDELPPFDPLRIFAAGGIFSADTKAPETETAEKGDAVHIDTVDFADAGDIVFDASDVIAPEEIASVVRDAVPFEIDSKVALTPGPAAAAPADGIAFQGFSPLPGAATFSDANSPVNETTISKTPADPTIEDADSVSVLTVAAGDTLSSLLGKVGIGRAEAAVVAKAMRPVYDPANLQPGQQVNFAVDSDAEGEPRLLRMSLFENGAHLASVKRGKDDGTYLALDASAEIVRPVITAAAAAPSGVRANIYKGLFESGIRNHIPRQILNRIVQVHSYDVDFQRPVQAGDNFSAFFELPDDSGAPPDPLPFYISLTVRGEGHGFYKFRTPDDGIIDYYDDEGRSAKKFLIRKPVNGGRLTSGFGARRHPLLRSSRMHWGVDWAAPRGTPIVAAGNGTIVEAKWKSGYGNWVKIRHSNGYETNYGHMTSHAQGIKAGVRVRQGQVIGYVGSTGLSTGPHVHYEVEVNGRKVDPLRIRLPRGRVLQGEMLAAFKREKARVDELMALPAAKSTVAYRDPEDSGQDAATKQIARR